MPTRRVTCEYQAYLALLDHLAVHDFQWIIADRDRLDRMLALDRPLPVYHVRLSPSAAQSAIEQIGQNESLWTRIKLIPLRQSSAYTMAIEDLYMVFDSAAAATLFKLKMK